MNHAGIDFGARNAGTSVCIFRDRDQWVIGQSLKKSDADRYLSDLIQELKPGHIFIDAPLSLPMVYRKDKISRESDFHYRHCDRETGAMSPMFLGGLTARAIRLRAEWEEAGIEVHETYPAHLVNILDAGEYYKKDLDRFLGKISDQTGFIPPPLSNWHEVDAFLAWISGMRHLSGKARKFGYPEEGLITV